MDTIPLNPYTAFPCRGEILVEYIITRLAPIRWRHNAFRHMVHPEICLYFCQAADQPIVPFQPPVSEFPPQDNCSNIPSVSPCNCHIMVTLHNVMERDISIRPSVCIVGACRLGFFCTSDSTILLISGSIISNNAWHILSSP